MFTKNVVARAYIGLSQPGTFHTIVKNTSAAIVANTACTVWHIAATAHIMTAENTMQTHYSYSYGP